VVLVTGPLGYVSLNKTLNVDVDGRVSEVNFMGRTVADALAAADVLVTDGDIVYPTLESKLDNGDSITVRTAKDIEVEIDGRREILTTNAATVGDVLDEMGTRAFGAEVSASRGTQIGRDLLTIQTLRKRGAFCRIGQSKRKNR
jgi:uncharacterized protein YabE (DUF348 family)